MNNAPTSLPTVCIVGRPNVGKSTLFNRIIGRRRAVVHETSGTTRDRIEALYKRGGGTVRLIDTGGYIRRGSGKMAASVRRQIEEAVKDADLLLLVCDVKSGILPQDEEAVSLLRKADKNVFLAVNKVDNIKLEDETHDFYRLGLGFPYPISALHNRGIENLTRELFRALRLEYGKGGREAVYKIAIVGRPNAGKSLFLNTLLKQERVIVDDVPGTTRDSIDTYFKKDNDLYLLIDTAGIRHKRKVKEPIDVYSVARSKEAIERADASFLLIDGYDGLRNDDVRIFSYIVESGKCCVIIVNKWDLVKRIPMAAYRDAIVHKTPSTAAYPIIFASAKTGRNIFSCVEMIKYIVANAKQKIQTKDLNEMMQYLRRRSNSITKKRPRLYYMVQTSGLPPTFLIFINDTRLVTREYSNFVENTLRREYNFYGTPIRLNYRKRKAG